MTSKVLIVLLKIQAFWDTTLCHCVSSLGLEVFDLEDEGTMLLHNVGNHSHNNTVSHLI